jgi:adenylate cyclase class IV
MFDIKLTEIEYKYPVSKKSKLTRQKFVDFCENLPYVDKLSVYGWDVYYSKSGPSLAKADFIRFRMGDDPQLTTKIKTTSGDNFERIETDVPLRKINKEDLESFVSSFVSTVGYKENFRIFKKCTIYYLQKTDIVFYDIYDKDMNHVNSFVEIEVRKDKKIKSSAEAFELINKLEKKLKKLGISKKDRTTKSLWEMYRHKPHG